MGEVLTDLGSFAPVNLVVLRDPNADTARRTLIAMNDRIRASASRPGAQVLFVYYSGHADSDALHLGPSRLDLGEVEQLVRGRRPDSGSSSSTPAAPARSRREGRHAAPPFPIRIGERLDGKAWCS